MPSSSTYLCPDGSSHPLHRESCHDDDAHGEGQRQPWCAALSSSSSRKRHGVRGQDEPDSEHYNTLGWNDRGAESAIQRFQLHSLSSFDLFNGLYRSRIHRPLGHRLGRSRIAQRNNLRRERSRPTSGSVDVTTNHSKLESNSSLQDNPGIQHQPYIHSILHNQALINSLQGLSALCMVRQRKLPVSIGHTRLEHSPGNPSRDV